MSISPADVEKAMQLMFGKYLTEAVGVLAELRVFDHISDTGSTASVLAEKCGANSNALYRTLRTLTLGGVVVESQDKQFTLTPMGKLFRWDTPGSMAAIYAFVAHKDRAPAHGHLIDAVKTGDAAFIHAYGYDGWSHFDRHDDVRRSHQTAMTALSHQSAALLAGSFDFSTFGVICDVGGGCGHLLGTILAKCPNARGILFDRPGVVAMAPEVLRELGVADRVDVVGGDMLDEVPSNVDVFILKHVLHTRSDEECVRVLKNCAVRLKPGGRVLIAEYIMTLPGVNDFSKLLDLEMLLFCQGAKERVEQEFVQLVADVALQFVQCIPGPISWIEAMKPLE